MYRVKIIIPGRVYSKNEWSYKKAAKGKKCGYAKSMEWEKTARQHADGQLKQQGFKDFPLFPTENVVMIIELRLHGKIRGDLQNYFKSICDSMQKKGHSPGVLYSDDKQITSIAGSIVEVDDKSKEQLTIWVGKDE